MPTWSENEIGPRAHPVAVAALLVSVAAILTGVVVFRPDATQDAIPQPIAQVASQPVIVAPTGTALVDAIPWGRIERIESAAGETHQPPTPRETPLVIELPEGAWRVALSKPGLDGEQICELEIVAGARADCLIEFERLTVDQYFREAGWWR